MQTNVVRQCVRKACSFRFPAEETNPIEIVCPKCGSPTLVAAFYPNNQVNVPSSYFPRIHLEGFLDNIRSVFNVGSIFRSADGCGVKMLHLRGITPQPTHAKMAKTALGADRHVPWSQHWDGLTSVNDIKNNAYEIIGLEYTATSTPLYEYKYSGKPLLLVVGNENHGIDPEILKTCEKIIHIPMAGQKESLNVSVAFSIAAYWIIYGIYSK
jgi:23S rRNA (guanosine2251-2'-O)-methyltransferase